ncbi:MAG: twin-arginine translocation signal domain-containing protein [Thermomicrobiales bacterium]
MGSEGFRSSGRPLTRRTFLKALGATGASAAVLGAMQAWGLAQEGSGVAMPPDLNGDVHGTKVIVIGAGPAGLATA